MTSFRLSSIFILLSFLCLWCAFSPGVAARAGQRSDERESRATFTLRENESRVRVEGRCAGEASASDRWRFRDEYAGVSNLFARIDRLTFYAANRTKVEWQLTAETGVIAAGGATDFAYEIDLRPAAREDDAAHVSWLGAERGMLMLGDLLPECATRDAANVELNLPGGWTAAGGGQAGGGARENSYRVRGADDVVFFVGRDLRAQSKKIGDTELRLVVGGDWPFSVEEAWRAAAAIWKEHEEALGDDRPLSLAGATVMLAPFPQSNPNAPQQRRRWSAETRGSSVVLLQSRLTSSAEALSLVSLNLAHELFHLWVPNALDLSGEYNWFYEGFTLYQALKVNVRLGHLTFQDLLNAIGRADDNYQQAKGGAAGELSLIEASTRRWSGQAAYVYNKGLLIAFWYDLTTSAADGGGGLGRAYRQLFRRHGKPRAHTAPSAERADGNRATLDALGEVGGPAVRDELRAYVEKGAPFDLASVARTNGLVVSSMGARAVLGVAPQLTETQRKILRGLGYNPPSERDRRLHERHKRNATRG